MLPDGSQFQVSRRSSRSRAASRPPSRTQEYKVEDSSEEGGDESSSSDDDESPHPFYTPLPGPSPHRRDQSPLPDQGSPGHPGTQGSQGHSGTPGGSGTLGDTPGRNRGLGQRFSKVKQKLHEKWIVGKPRDIRPSPIRPALPSPRPLGSPENLTPLAPARPEEPGQSLSPGPGPRRDRPLRLRSPGEPAAPQHPPALGRRSRQPPARYESEDFTPAHKVNEHQ